MPDQPDNRPLALYVIRTGEGFRIAADGSAAWQLGWKALQRLRAANPGDARQWLEWAAQELQAPGESTRRPHPFLELWTPEFR